MSRTRLTTQVAVRDIRNTTASSHLDLMRGLAAIAVLTSHLRNIFFVDYAELHSQQKVWFTAAAYFLTDLGHQAVIVFFVLSGFLIGGSVLKLVADGCWSWRTYLISRCSRLYVVLIPALVLGLLLDRTGMELSGGIYTGGAHNHVIEFSVAQRSGVVTLLGNLLFLQQILVKPFGSNGALWSLSYEFWYYIIFPFLVFIVVSRDATIRLMSVVVAGLVLLFVGTNISLYLTVWLCGAGINVIPASRRLLRGPTALFAGSVFFLTLAESRLTVLVSSSVLNDFSLGLATAALIYIWVNEHRPAEARPKYTWVARTVAGFSYTLYLVHLPLLVLIKSLTNPSRWQPSMVTVASGFAIAVAALIYAAAIAYCTERRTDSARHYLAHLIESFQHAVSFTHRRTSDESAA